MIGKLSGKIDSIGEAYCIIDVNGVGYEVFASARALQNMTVGAAATLTIDTHVREDAIRLYGFASERERAWFRTLQTVQGVGAKVALACLGVLSPQDLANAIALGDAAAIGQTPGIGKKLAQRITSELREKAPVLAISDIGSGEVPSTATSSAAVGMTSDSSAAAEAISALSNLGYQPLDASRAVAAAQKDLGADADTATLIRQGLKALSR
ncbi:MAG: Holliday junction branch migration protein RuvA [Pseudomonadota bacterium]